MSIVRIKIGTNEEVLIGNNADNAAKEAGRNAAIDAIKTSAYGLALSSGLKNKPTNEELLKPYSKANINSLCLYINKGVKEPADIELIDIFVDITQDHDIVKTNIGGNNEIGTVKELVNTRDYIIRIEGQIHHHINDKKENFHNIFPHKEFKTLITLLEKHKSFYVTHVFANAVGIHKIAYERGSFNQSAMKFFNVMPFSLQFVSDKDYDFLVLDA